MTLIYHWEKDIDVRSVKTVLNTFYVHTVQEHIVQNFNIANIIHAHSALNSLNTLNVHFAVGRTIILLSSNWDRKELVPVPNVKNIMLLTAINVKPRSILITMILNKVERKIVLHVKQF